MDIQLLLVPYDPRQRGCRSQVLLVFDDTVTGKVVRMTRDPSAPFRTP